MPRSLQLHSCCFTLTAQPLKLLEEDLERERRKVEDVRVVWAGFTCLLSPSTRPQKTGSETRLCEHLHRTRGALHLPGLSLVVSDTHLRAQTELRAQTQGYRLRKDIWAMGMRAQRSCRRCGFRAGLGRDVDFGQVTGNGENKQRDSLMQLRVHRKVASILKAAASGVSLVPRNMLYFGRIVGPLILWAAFYCCFDANIVCRTAELRMRLLCLSDRRSAGFLSPLIWVFDKHLSSNNFQLADQSKVLQLE